MSGNRHFAFRGREISAGEGFQEQIRIVAGAIGIVAIILGFFFAGKLFFAVKDGLEHPGDVHPIIVEWEEVLGGDELSAPVGDGELGLARVIAVVIVGAGTVVLVWIALGFVRTGARVISWVISDLGAMRKLTTELDQRVEDVATGVAASVAKSDQGDTR